jgi:hypothetical protein
MRRLLLLALTLAASPAAAAVPSGCQEDYVTCKEDCTIEYGGSSRAISQLTRCISQCQQTLDTCAARHSSLKTPAGAANARAREDDPYADVAEEPKRGGGGKAAPAAEAAPVSSKSPAVTRQGVYRASEAQAAPEPKPAPAPPPEPAEDEGLAPMDDVPPPAPKQAAKSAQKPAPKKEPAPVVVTSEDEKDPLLDEEPPPPPPEKKVAPVVKPSRPESPPEPKKKDISEWDPNGD